MGSLKNFAVAWLIMWGISYVMVALVAPGVSDVEPWIYALLGAAIVFVSLGTYFTMQEPSANPLIYSVALIVLAVLQVWGGVTSWTGEFIWNVPFASKEIFQVSMAFADFIAAAFMIWLSLELWN